MEGASMTERLSNDTARAFLRQMLAIRRAEEAVIHFATDHKGLIRGHYHVYIGQEATGVGTCAALGPDDYVFTTHRNHGHVIARGGELGPVLAEIIGRTTGYNRGRGGTFHVIAPHLGILQTSGVVGGCMPLAAGAAFSIKKRGTDQVSVVFFGDGVLEEGAFYESINMASLWKLPVILLCENNDVEHALRRGGASVSSSLAARQLTDISSAFSIPSVIVDGCNVAAVHSAVSEAVVKARGGAGPVFIEARITRWPGNRGQFPTLVGGDYQLEWALSPASAPKELQDWLQYSDPVALLARSLVQAGGVTTRDLAAVDDEVRKAVGEAVRFALDSPAPKPEAALDHVFAT
jgi:acetoin:2,6-dichlorophenolindophenol oxidoreductase subunit alpha